MLYSCPRCGFETQKKTDFIRHLSRKDPCIAKNKNISIKAIKNSFNFIQHAGKQQNTGNYAHECHYCHRKYKYKYNLNKHLKTCTVKRDMETHKECDDNDFHELKNRILSLEAIVQQLSTTKTVQ